MKLFISCKPVAEHFVCIGECRVFSRWIPPECAPKNGGVANVVITFTNLNLSTISLTQAVAVLSSISVSVPTLATTNMFVGNNAADTSGRRCWRPFWVQPMWM